MCCSPEAEFYKFVHDIDDHCIFIFEDGSRFILLSLKSSKDNPRQG